MTDSRRSILPPPLAPDGRPITPGLVAIGLAPLVAGTAVGLVTNASGQPWYRRLSKPAWTPPDAVFGPVWTVLYLLMGVALVLVVRERPSTAGSTGSVASGDRRSRTTLALGAFGTQLVLNLLWSIVFFGARRVRLAAAEIAILWTAILTTIVTFGRVRVAAALLLVPYLAWSTFAAALNAEIARRNRS